MIDLNIISQKNTIAADASSLLYLLRLDVLSAYCNHKNMLVPRTVFDELTVPGKRGAEIFLQLTKDSVLAVADTNGSHAVGGTSKKLSEADRSVIQLYQTGRPHAVLTDDGALCRYCRRRRIPYINTPMALFSLAYNKCIQRAVYYKLLEKSYQEGRYAPFVKRYMNALNRRYLMGH